MRKLTNPGYAYKPLKSNKSRIPALYVLPYSFGLSGTPWRFSRSCGTLKKYAQKAYSKSIEGDRVMDWNKAEPEAEVSDRRTVTASET